ncbi:MAG: hypothetical protein HKP56_07955, partial [Anderseniella sp.]|nr:hypothetical protein [Anderseniella sp.]
RLSFLGCVVVGLFFLVLVFHPATREENAKFSSCRNNITSECLTDLGVDRAMSSRSLTPDAPAVRMLAQMGRFDDAFALVVREGEAREGLGEELESFVNRTLASHRIAAAIRSGESLQMALDQTPSVDPGVLWISALDLLGRNPYEVSIGQTTSPDDQTLIIVADIAAAIDTMARTEPGPLHTTHLIYAAELQAAAGNRIEVIQLLEQIPQTENSRINLTEDVVRLIGSETALRLYHSAGGRRPNLLLTAAVVEPDPARAVAYLDRAFEAFSTKTPWRDFNGMERTVRRSADLGYKDHALRLAREMAQKAQTEPASIPVFPYIMAARALLAAGAEKSEIRQSLNLAPSFFSQDDRKIVGMDVVDRPILWGTTGLGAQARREVANLRAQLGDMNISIRMMDGLKNSIFT